MKCVRTYSCRECRRTFTSAAKARACEADHERQEGVGR